MIQVLMQYEFLRNAFMVGIIVGFLAPLLGVFLVVRRLPMLADALAHITLAGIACSLFLGKYVPIFTSINPMYLGTAFSFVGALGIERLRQTYSHYQELAIPIILSAGIGSSVIFISLAGGFNVDLFNFLFGSIIAVRRSDVWLIIIIACIVLALVLSLYKELFSSAFDAEQAVATGLPLSMLNFIFTVLIAAVIALPVRIVGVLLVSALMVLPVATSMKIANSFKGTLLLAIIFGEIAVLSGLYLSFINDWSPGGTIVVISLLLLILTIIFKKCREKLSIDG